MYQCKYLMQHQLVDETQMKLQYGTLIDNLDDLWELNGNSLCYLQQNNSFISKSMKTPEMELIKRKTAKFEQAFSLYSNKIGKGSQLYAECIDLIRFNHELAYSIKGECINRQLMQNQSNFSMANDSSLAVITWNLADRKSVV